MVFGYDATVYELATTLSLVETNACGLSETFSRNDAVQNHEYTRIPLSGTNPIG